jgi:hypothetical protein
MLTPHRIAQPHTAVWGYWDFVPLAQEERTTRLSIVNRQFRLQGVLNSGQKNRAVAMRQPY